MNRALRLISASCPSGERDGDRREERASLWSGPRAALWVAALAIGGLTVAGVGSAGTTKPAIRDFRPKLGYAGTVLRISGSNLTGATAVKVGGQAATFNVVSGGMITATVPGNALTGRISVTTKDGTDRSTSPFSVVAPNGSGTLIASPTTVATGATGQTITFTYTVAADGINDGAVTITVPSGWSAPATTATVGCTTTSIGLLTASGQQIAVRQLTLPAGSTVTITYGATSALLGGPCKAGDGATAPASSGPVTWQTQERSLYSGKLTNIASSPSITTT
jgi:hypothetical protein